MLLHAMHCTASVPQVWQCKVCLMARAPINDRVGPTAGAFPLELAATKSRGGHAETGAGAVGLHAAVLRLRTVQQQPIAHLHAVNAHVCEALDSHAAIRWGVPRSAAAAAAGDCTAGISTFAFQGTNAHAVLCSASAALRCTGAEEGLWLRHRLHLHTCAYAPQQAEALV